MLERPFGSVRWKDDSPDRVTAEMLPEIPSGKGLTQLATPTDQMTQHAESYRKAASGSK